MKPLALTNFSSLGQTAPLQRAAAKGLVFALTRPFARHSVEIIV